MIITTARPNAPIRPTIVICSRCKDRVRFESCNVNETVCTCTVARWGRANNALRFAVIRGRVSAHECSHKCTHAKTGDCECSCGGANHGRGWS